MMDKNRMLNIRMGGKSKIRLDNTPEKALKRKIIRWVVLLVCAYMFVAGNRGLLHLVRMKSEAASLGKEIDKLETEHNRTDAERAALKQDLKAVERIAREELGLVKKGEVVFRFTGPGAEENRNK